MMQMKKINDSYFISNLRAAYRLPDSKFGYFELYAGIVNLTNTHYSPMLTVNAVAFGNAEQDITTLVYLDTIMGVRFNINSQ